MLYAPINCYRFAGPQRDRREFLVVRIYGICLPYDFVDAAVSIQGAHAITRPRPDEHFLFVLSVNAEVRLTSEQFRAFNPPKSPLLFHAEQCDANRRRLYSLQICCKQLGPIARMCCPVSIPAKQKGVIFCGYPALRSLFDRYARLKLIGQQRRRPVSVRQNLQGLYIDGCLFWSHNLCIVVRAHTSISETGIEKIKRSSIILVYTIFVIFGLPVAKIQLLQGQVIHATKQVDRDTSDLFSKFLTACDENQNYAHWDLFETRCCSYSKSNTFSSLHIEGRHIFVKNLSDFRRSTGAAWTANFSFSLP
jgi:hypothetical protein